MEGWREYLDGRTRYVSTFYEPYVKPDGTIAGFYVFNTDETEVKLAERENDRLIRLLRDAIDAMPHGFAIFDEDRNLVFGNQFSGELALALEAIEP